MTNTTDLSINSLINAGNFDDPFILSPMTQAFIEQCSKEVTANEGFEYISINDSNSSNMTVQSPSDISPSNNLNHQESSNIVSQAAAFPVNIQSDSTRIQIIAQPYYGTKLRYRSDYEKNENRLGVLKNKTKNSSYQGPAIRIPQSYCISNGEYFIRVSLVTIKYNQTGLHYLHPYEIEHPSNTELNDRDNNAVWFPIQQEDCITGIKSFSLRIVKKRASDLKMYGNLRVFDCENINLHNNSLPQLPNAKDTISEYNLDQSQLVFTVGRKLINNNQISFHIYPETTVYSEEMIEGIGKEVDNDTDISSPNDKPITSSSICRVYRYAPKYGYDQTHEDMVIFLTCKPEPKKYGEVKVIFQCDISGNIWSQPINDLDIKDRMITFKTPLFPYSIDEIQTVDVIIQQDNRIIETIKYFYLTLFPQCANCQLNAIQTTTNSIPNTPHKRRTNILDRIPFDEDDKLESDDSLSTPSPPIAHESNSPQQPSTNADLCEQMMDKLSISVKSIFIDNDYNTFFRICRSFLQKSPDLLHHSLDNNHYDLLLKFLPTSTINILQQKNSLGETIFLHALRLNQINLIEILLKKDKSQKLLYDIDNNKNNIFHIIALNSVSSELIDLLINYFITHSIDISKEFDEFNNDHWTPLQLSICKNNFLATKYFLKYFNTKICATKNSTGDNLIHLAIRYSNLTMIKYLIEDSQLIEQSKQSNLNMTPIELAKFLKHNEIIEYFNQIYPEQEINDNDSSSDED